MSEAAPEAPARAPARAGGNVFTRKLGPLPMWVWLLIAAAGVLGYSVWKGKKQAASSTTQTATGTDASQVPQFVNQTYTTVIPPSAPTPEPPEGPEPQPRPIVPGKPPPKPRPAGPPPRRVHEYKVPGRGKTPSLEEIARQFHTTPQAIITASEGRGNPHGAAWNRYVRARNWNAPLPHGTNLDILAA